MLCNDVHLVKERAQEKGASMSNYIHFPLKSPVMVLAFILYTYVALELCMLLKDVNDGSRILIKVKVTFIKPDV